MDIENVYEQILSGGKPALPPHFSSTSFIVFTSSHSYVSLSSWRNVAVHLLQQRRERDLYQILSNAANRIQKQGQGMHQQRSQGDIQERIWLYNSLAGIQLKWAQREENRPDFDVRVKELQTIINKSDKLYLNCSLTFSLKGLLKLTLGNIQKSSQEFKNALSQHDHLSVISPLLGLAQLHFAKRNYTESLKQFKAALKLNPNLPANARLGMGHCFYHLKKYQLAQICFKRVLELDSKNAGGHLGLAVLCHLRNEDSLYFKHLQTAHQCQPNNPFVLLHIVEHLFILDKLQELERLCVKGLTACGKRTRYQLAEGCRNDVDELKQKFNFYLGYCQQRRGTYQQAIKYYLLCKNFKPALINVAFIQYNSSNYQGASKTLEPLMGTTAKKQQLTYDYRLFAQVKVKLQLRSEAIQFYKLALKFDPEDVSSLLQFSNLMIEVDPGKSLQLLRKIQQIYQNSVESLQCIPQVYNNLAVLLMEENQLELAQSYLHKALSLALSLQEISVRKTGYLLVVYCNFALLYQRMRNHTTANQFLQKAVKINPRYIDLFTIRAQGHFEEGENEKGLECLQEGLNLLKELRAKDMPKKYLRQDNLIAAKGYILYKMGFESQAKSVFKSNKHNYCQLFYQAIELYSSSAKKDNALHKTKLKTILRSVSKVHQMEKNNFWAAMMMVCTMAELRPKFVQLDSSFEMLMEKQNEFPKILYNRGIYQLNNGNLSLARQCLEKFNSKVRANKNGKTALAQVYLCLNQYQKSIDILKNLTLLYPADLEVRFNLGMANIKKALACFQKTDKTIEDVTNSIEMFKVCHQLNEVILRGSPIQERLNELTNVDLRDHIRQDLQKIKDEAQFQIVVYKSERSKFDNYLYEAQCFEKEQRAKRHFLYEHEMQLMQQELNDIEEEHREQELREKRLRMQEQARQMQRRFNQRLLQEKLKQKEPKKKKKKKDKEEQGIQEFLKD